MQINPNYARYSYASRGNYNCKTKLIEFGSSNLEQRNEVRFDGKTLQIVNSKDGKLYSIDENGSCEISQEGKVEQKIESNRLINVYDAAYNNRGYLIESTRIKLISYLNETLEQIKDDKLPYFDDEGNRNYDKKVKSNSPFDRHKYTIEITKSGRRGKYEIYTKENGCFDSDTYHMIRFDGSGLVDATHWDKGTKVKEGTLSNVYKALESCSEEEYKSNYYIQKAIVELLDKTIEGISEE